MVLFSLAGDRGVSGLAGNKALSSLVGDISSAGNRSVFNLISNGVFNLVGNTGIFSLVGDRADKALPRAGNEGLL